jgi:hypothetical protein
LANASKIATQHEEWAVQFRRENEQVRDSSEDETFTDRLKALGYLQ